MDDFSPQFEPSAIDVMALEIGPLISFEEDSDTLIVDQVEIRLDQQLGDDDLGVSLLVESLEQEYQELKSPIENLVESQRKAANKFLTEAKKLFAEGYHGANEQHKTNYSFCIHKGDNFLSHNRLLQTTFKPVLQGKVLSGQPTGEQSQCGKRC